MKTGFLKLFSHCLIQKTDYETAMIYFDTGYMFIAKAVSVQVVTAHQNQKI